MKGLFLSAVMMAGAPCSGPVTPTANGAQPAAQPTTTAPNPPPTTGATKPPTVCPSLQIKAPDVIEAGRVGRVTLILTDAVGTPSYRWTLSAGVIESGQGTPSIAVRPTNLWGSPITATVEVGNLPAECLTTRASIIFLVAN